MLINRTAGGTATKLARAYPVVVITGPRQSGKTTLTRASFPDKPYVSLEDPDQRDFAKEDPRRFLSQYPDGAVLDEVQRVPDLFSYLQTRVDQDLRPGLFVLSGSQQFGVLSQVTQSLAGRVALVPLLPFSLEELQDASREPHTLEEVLFTGFYPAIYDRGISPEIWYGNYVQTYIERDVRQMINVRDLSVFQRFVRMCAGRTGRLVNLTGLANDCGISHNTAKSWLSVLQASYIVHLLPPHHRNFDKRLLKTPKLYFLDPGLACWLMGIQNGKQIEFHPMRGALFETLVVSELLKKRFHRGLTSNLFFWQDRHGREVDILIDQGQQLVPVEVKSGQTIASSYFTGLSRWVSLAGQEAGGPWVVYGGTERQSRSQAEVLPWREMRDLAPDQE